ncbi:stage V sporulation protein AA [Melghirimyces profundicolus]|uniref:Stage V sporulation protein AA n=1 Tax=Melghirimyces profundicolus TaxID=1242148 RepID=A0A2T6B4D0_9BACL|nr:stage V sporulation protein AA [Melghirimyces profundicolus]PTX50872.1 stage V sporulation protein AA [Melghirimyces profundicolus]
MVSGQVFLQMKKRIRAKPDQVLRVGDVAVVLAEKKEELESLPVSRPNDMEGDLAIVDLMDVIRVLRVKDPDLDIRTVGLPQTLVEFHSPRTIPPAAAVAAVWLLLFVGSGLAIMNFHTDVSMKEVHERIYYLMTGVQTSRPLILQIPYSLGIGLGMVLFFNHVFRGKFNEEPSPLELEVFLYQENIDQYVIDHEKSHKRGDRRVPSG